MLCKPNDHRKKLFICLALCYDTGRKYCGGKHMLIDITLEITQELAKKAPGSSDKALAGHLGTHFDVMNKEFPLAYTQRKGIVFDVSSVKDRDISTGDITLEEIHRDMFVAFYTGFLEETGYGTKTYFAEHPQLSRELIDALLAKGVSIIGVDFAGVRRGKEHTPMDQYCADRGTFVIENLCNLKVLVDAGRHFRANTYPMRYADITGLPCRVIAEI